MSDKSIIYNSDKIKNSSGDIINPATQENQSTLNNLIDALHDLNARLAFLAGAKGALADLRVTPTGTVTITGTIPTVSTLSNQTQTGGYFTNPIVQGQTNLTAIHSNISNISL